MKKVKTGKLRPLYIAAMIVLLAALMINTTFGLKDGVRYTNEFAGSKDGGKPTHTKPPKPTDPPPTTPSPTDSPPTTPSPTDPPPTETKPTVTKPTETPTETPTDTPTDTEPTDPPPTNTPPTAPPTSGEQLEDIDDGGIPGAGLDHEPEEEETTDEQRGQGAPGETSSGARPWSPGSSGTFPKTGDDADPRLWLIAAVISAIALRKILFHKKEDNNAQKGEGSK